MPCLNRLSTYAKKYVSFMQNIGASTARPLATIENTMLFTNGGTCLFDIVHSALWGSEYPVCTPDAQVLFLNGARMLHTQHSAVQALSGGV
jgi:hypothetical protein